ncbi:MAG TPA: bifunctional adenosylcobinamide kinase/adenosylcobinamide-phosphate guanylyltransferase [Syntrophales bacterium]|mgnify:CR=1 FL=1|jgi:adenosylcobinamide kinase/adenosylcobinamide-phosphate guanylyltransferase|nr:bifunctional adenosylcobinamide kinase/adenosylcobinamide-phosphate guanylyltransferase [Syntrophales bacterium]
MAEIILVTGGSRSGKSRYAQELAESMAGKRAFVATCPVVDEEMAERIRRHQRARGAGWITIEETVDLPGALRRAAGSGVVLVDCLTLWVNNLLYEETLRSAREDGTEGPAGASGMSEDEMEARSRDVLRACADIPGTVIFVTNEVGMGIVPENALSRRFRDLAGRCNQVIAGGADRVVLMVSGIAATIKGGDLRRNE